MSSFIQFLIPGQDLSVTYLGTYDASLVTLSVMTAIFASFIALELSGRIIHADTLIGKIVWLIPGSLALGGGVWAMHFIGMLAFSLPCGVSYDPILTLLSIVPGMLASAAALWTISRARLSFFKLVRGGVLMGGGIGTMHYSGMAAMQMDAVIYYSPAAFSLSIGFAIVLAIVSLQAKFVLQHQQELPAGWPRSLAGAVFMGVAISGMHYIAMEAAYFIPVDNNSAAVPGLAPTVLAVGIGVTTVMLLALTLAGIILGRHLETIRQLKREIGERQQAERRTRKLFQAVEQSSATVVITDIDGNIEYVNRKFSETTGYSAEEVAGRNPRLLKSGHTSPEEYKALWGTITAGKEWRGEFHNRRKDGTLYWESASISPIKARDGRTINFLAIKEDITKRKEAESQMLQAKEEAEYANHAKAQFLANMSHELRTPLNGIIGFSEMMMMQMLGPMPEAYNDYATDIHNAGEHLLELITDILDTAKLDMGEVNLVETDIDLHELMRDCLKIFQIKARDADVSISTDIPKGLASLRADKTRIKQVMINLLSNSVKFTSRGGRVIVSACEDGDGAMTVRVKDTGRGIAAADIPKVLEPFKQVEDVMSRSHEGSGLGLPLSKRLIELHGGSFLIDSEPGKGTTVTVRFPSERVGRSSGIDDAVSRKQDGDPGT
ncbi:MAG: sensor histidine kinase [Alphaproteobacteria bacterium]